MFRAIAQLYLGHAAETDAWADAVAAARGRGEEFVLDPIRLHDCRHTPAS